MNIGENGEPGHLLDASQHVEAGGEPRAAERRQRGAIRLVVRRLEDQRHPQPFADLLQRRGGGDSVCFALDDARPGDDGERVAGADGEGADLNHADGLHQAWVTPAVASVVPLFCRCCAAATKLANNGCGLSGRDWNSG